MTQQTQRVKVLCALLSDEIDLRNPLTYFGVPLPEAFKNGINDYEGKTATDETVYTWLYKSVLEVAENAALSIAIGVLSNGSNEDPATRMAKPVNKSCGTVPYRAQIYKNLDQIFALHSFLLEQAALMVGNEANPNKLSLLGASARGIRISSLLLHCLQCCVIYLDWDYSISGHSVSNSDHQGNWLRCKKHIKSSSKQHSKTDQLWHENLSQACTYFGNSAISGNCVACSASSGIPSGPENLKLEQQRQLAVIMHDETLVALHHWLEAVTGGKTHITAVHSYPIVNLVESDSDDASVPPVGSIGAKCCGGARGRRGKSSVGLQWHFNFRADLREKVEEYIEAFNDEDNSLGNRKKFICSTINFPKSSSAKECPPKPHKYSWDFGPINIKSSQVLPKTETKSSRSILDDTDSEEEEGAASASPSNSGDSMQVLLLCDGCEGEMTLRNSGLSVVPKGAWYCLSCRIAPEQHDKPTEQAKQTMVASCGVSSIRLPVVGSDHQVSDDCIPAMPNMVQSTLHPPKAASAAATDGHGTGEMRPSATISPDREEVIPDCMVNEIESRSKKVNKSNEIPRVKAPSLLLEAKQQKTLQLEVLQQKPILKRVTEEPLQPKNCENSALRIETPLRVSFTGETPGCNHVPRRLGGTLARACNSALKTLELEPANSKPNLRPVDEQHPLAEKKGKLVGKAASVTVEPVVEQSPPIVLSLTPTPTLSLTFSPETFSTNPTETEENQASPPRKLMSKRKREPSISTTSALSESAPTETPFAAPIGFVSRRKTNADKIRGSGGKFAGKLQFAALSLQNQTTAPTGRQIVSGIINCPSSNNNAYTDAVMQAAAELRHACASFKRNIACQK